MSAEDAVQDAAVILIEMRDRWDESKSAHLPYERRERMVIAWARLRLIDKYETEFRVSRRTANLAGVDTLDARYDGRLSELDREEVRDLVTRLPERQRTVVTGLLFEGKTQQEIADDLGVSQTAVCANYERARESLRTLLADFSLIRG